MIYIAVVDLNPLSEGTQDFLKLASVVRASKNMKIGYIYYLELEEKIYTYMLLAGLFAQFETVRLFEDRVCFDQWLDLVNLPAASAEQYEPIIARTRVLYKHND